ncbi:MAG: glycerol-3-phosphate acyltransferase, partial [Dehalococcoidales bacterium]
MTDEIGISVLALILAYLLGSIPSAYLAGRLRKGIDIRQVGTRNMGAMNVFYQVGFASGVLVLIADMGKGVAALALARWLGAPEITVLLAGAAAIA